MKTIDTVGNVWEIKSKNSKYTVESRAKLSDRENEWEGLWRKEVEEEKELEEEEG